VCFKLRKLASSTRVRFRLTLVQEKHPLAANQLAARMQETHDTESVKTIIHPVKLSGSDANAKVAIQTRMRGWRHTRGSPGIRWLR